MELWELQETGISLMGTLLRTSTVGARSSFPPPHTLILAVLLLIQVG